MHRSPLKLAAVALALGLAGPALAQTGPVQLVELSTGAPTDPTAQYVALRVAPGADLSGDRLAVQNASGAPLADFKAFTTSPTPTAAGYLLVGAPSVATVYGVSPAVTADAESLPFDGRLCLLEQGNPVDCVAWGQYTGNLGTWGAPVVAGGQLGHALVRIQYTGVNTADWQVETPHPERYVGSAGVDGGVVDGGTTDGGIADGGVSDGGIADGGVTDGGATDGGAVDGGGGGGGSTGAGGGSIQYGGSNVPTTGTGCSCSAAGGSFTPGALLVLLGLVALRRRRPVDPGFGRR